MRTAAFRAASPSFPPPVTSIAHIYFPPGPKLESRLTLIQSSVRGLLWKILRSSANAEG